MSKNKIALGRGLASLIPRGDERPASTAPAADDGHATEVIVQVDVDRIARNPYQPRAEFDPVALDELKRSIQEKGVIQPITVRRVPDGYQIISGERRVRASREAGLRRIPAYVISVDTEEEMLELALIENLQREQLNPIEVAISYKRLIDECRYTQDDVARKIGKNRTTVTNVLRLLKLPEEIQNAVRRGELSGGHARALAGLEDRRFQQKVFKRIIAKGLSVRQVEELVRLKDVPPQSGGKTTRGGAHGSVSVLSSSEDRLRQLLGTRVQISHLQGGKGQIVIEYYTADDLDRILDLFDQLSP